MQYMKIQTTKCTLLTVHAIPFKINSEKLTSAKKIRKRCDGNEPINDI